MNCKICFEKFNLNKHKPYTVIPCGHSFCICCIETLPNKVCPVCREPIVDQKINYVVYDFLEETDGGSDEDVSSKMIDESLNEIKELKNKFHLNYQKKFIDNKDKLHGIKTEITNKTKDIIRKLITNQEKLLNETEKIEKTIVKRFNESLLNEQQIESNIEDLMDNISSKKVETADMKKLKEKLKKTKTQFTTRLDALEELNFNYELKSNEYMSLNNEINLLGEVLDKNCKIILQSNQIVSCSDDMTIKLWDRTNGSCIKTFQGHSSAVHSVKFFSNSKIVSGSGDNTIKMWDIKTGDCLKTFYGHSGTVFSIEILPNDQLCSGSADKTLKIWDLKTGSSGNCIRTLNGHTNVIQCIALVSNEQIASGSTDNSIKIWFINTGECIRTLDGHNSWITSLKVKNDQLFSGSTDTFIKIWDLKMFRCVKTIQAHSHSVDSLELLSVDTILSGSYDETIKMWDAKTGKNIKILEGNSESFECLKLIGDDQLVSCSSGKFPEINAIKLWDLKTGRCLKSLIGHSGAVWAVDYLKQN